MREFYDVIVIGGGHAGTEAAWAAVGTAALRAASSKVPRFSEPRVSGSGRAIGEETPGSESRGTSIALITMAPARIGQMSCNPAIGGLAKGQMVREIDALGGIMGLAIDATGIMFKQLNTSKGAAVRGPRAQADKYAYAAEVQRLIATRGDAIDVIAGTVDDLVVEDGRIVGVVLPAGAGVVQADESAIEWNLANAGLARPVYEDPHPRPLSHPRTGERGDGSPLPLGEGLGEGASLLVRASAVVLTTGTFMRGLMHTGEQQTPGGRVDEGSAAVMSATLKRLGFELGRLKTGTPPRLDRNTIDWDELERQVGDDAPIPFSDLSPCALPGERFPHLPQAECRTTHTTAEIHELIRANLDRAPLFSGQIDAECGPRYCPSIEDKVVRFADRDSHHVFLEPESLHTDEIYCNGISTSLPIDVQEKIVHLMPGCARATVLRWGYAVEYDMVWPHQIDATCMTKSIAGLFLAGQINCTTGYEEAGGQGLIAGLNAARFARGEEPVRLGRDQAYIGVMLDDLVTKTPREPYRMFTSRAEHRLLLRADNADTRLTPIGRELGLVDDQRWTAYEKRTAELAGIERDFDSITVEGKTLREIVRRPEVTVSEVAAHLRNGYDPRLVERVMTDAKYEGYIARQRAEIRRQTEADGRGIPDWLDLAAIPGLRAEAAEVLGRFRPATLGQASRLAGVNPADVTLLAVAIRRGRGSADTVDAATSPI